MINLPICHRSIEEAKRHQESHVLQVCTATVTHCKFCGSRRIRKFGRIKDFQIYYCNDCGRKFTEKDTPDGKQTETAMIGAALGLFFDGLSCGDISHQLESIYHDVINPSTIYRWIMEYSRKAHDFMDTLKAQTSDTWVVDETVVEVAGQKVWYWDVIDENSRYLINTHISESRTINDARILFEHCKKRTSKPPHFILSDGMLAYMTE